MANIFSPDFKLLFIYAARYLIIPIFITGKQTDGCEIRYEIECKISYEIECEIRHEISYEIECEISYRNYKITKRKKPHNPAHRPNHKTFVSAPPGVRTLDTLIKSQVLYQLS